MTRQSKLIKHADRQTITVIPGIFYWVIRVGQVRKTKSAPYCKQPAIGKGERWLYKISGTDRMPHDGIIVIKIRQTYTGFLIAIGQAIGGGIKFQAGVFHTNAKRSGT